MMPRATFSIEDAIARGGKIIECREHNNGRSKFSVKVVVPAASDDEDPIQLTYTNISSHLISMFTRTGAKPGKTRASGAGHKSATSPKSSSARVTKPSRNPPKPEVSEPALSEHSSSDREYYRPQESPTITTPLDYAMYAIPHIIYLRMGDGQIEVFGNVSRARIEAIQQHTLARQNGWLGGMESNEAEDALDSCVKKGGVIIHAEVSQTQQQPSAAKVAQVAQVFANVNGNSSGYGYPPPEVDWKQFYAITAGQPNTGLKVYT